MSHPGRAAATPDNISTDSSTGISTDDPIDHRKQDPIGDDIDHRFGPAGVLRSRLIERLPIPLVIYWRPFVAGVVIVLGLAILVFDRNDDVTADGTAGGAVDRVVAGPTSPTTAQQTPSDLMVQVSGAVESPGVFELAEGSRVEDAVAAAGGLNREADPERVNLASKVVDGERIYVMRKGQTLAPPIDTGTSASGSASGTGGTTGPVNLNTATAEALVELPGVGPATAKSIIDHRQKGGGFKSVDDLQDVKGIGPAKFEQIKSLVRV